MKKLLTNIATIPDNQFVTQKHIYMVNKATFRKIGFIVSFKGICDPISSVLIRKIELYSFCGFYWSDRFAIKGTAPKGIEQNIFFCCNNQDHLDCLSRTHAHSAQPYSFVWTWTWYSIDLEKYRWSLDKLSFGLSLCIGCHRIINTSTPNCFTLFAFVDCNIWVWIFWRNRMEGWGVWKVKDLEIRSLEMILTI